jgi:hypothetical protein
MRALETQEDKLKQLKELWTVTRPLRSELTIRERMEEGDALALVPLLPDEDPGSQLCPVAFNLLASALDSLGHLYRVEPERSSPSAERWAQVLWDHGYLRAFSGQMAELDRTVRLHGAALAVVVPEIEGFSLQVYSPARYVALSSPTDDRRTQAVLIHWSGKRDATERPTTWYTGVAPTMDEVQRKIREESQAHDLVDEAENIWVYVDDEVTQRYTGNVSKLSITSNERHGYGTCPAVVVSGDLIKRGLFGQPWGGRDLLTNLMSTQKLLGQTGETSIMQRGQPTAAGVIEGPITLSPKHVIKTSVVGGFQIVGNAGNPSAQLEVGKAFVALTALSLGAPVTSMWRLADITESDLRAAELVLAADRPDREIVMARAEAEVCAMISDCWHGLTRERLEPWSVKFKTPQLPLSASERLAIETEKDDRKLAPRAAVAQALSPELSAAEIEEQIEAADEEAERAVHALALVAGHAGDVQDGRSDLRNPASDARPASPSTGDDPGSGSPDSGPSAGAES